MYLEKEVSSIIELRLVAELSALVGTDGVIDQHEHLRTYASDALTAYKMTPTLTCSPMTTTGFRMKLFHSN
ncbi:MAG: hypothetical protein NVS4B12_06870 [Ktedonobacteraceae bacterium]